MMDRQGGFYRRYERGRASRPGRGAHTYDADPSAVPLQRAGCRDEQSRARRWLQVAATAELRARDREWTLSVRVAGRSLASRSLSMLTWSLSILVSTLRATASRSAMSGEASE